MPTFKDIPLVPVPRTTSHDVTCRDCGRDYYANGQRADLNACNRGKWVCGDDNKHYPGQKIAWVTPEKKTEMAIRILEN